MTRVLIVLMLLCAPMTAQAHNVIASVFPSGKSIEGEIGMSDGTMAVEKLVEVFDDAGNKLGETTTDGDGFFLFTPTQAVTHIFTSDLGAGHLAQTRMQAADVAEILGVAASNPAANASVLGGKPEAAAMLTQTGPSKDEIADMLRRELRPLRQEITALKTQQSFQSVLGGIGYIVGLFGLGFYLAARRKLKEHA